MKSEIIFFNKIENTYFVITTNRFTEELRALVSEYENLHYKVEIFYTDENGFSECVRRYELKTQEEQKRMQEIQYQQKAQGKTAIQTMKELFGRKDTMEAGDFVMEIVSWAPLVFHKNNGMISRFPNTIRSPHLVKSSEYSDMRDGQLPEV